VSLAPEEKLQPGRFQLLGGRRSPDEKTPGGQDVQRIGLRRGKAGGKKGCLPGRERKGKPAK
jgi:hypothetical protein